MSNQKVTQEAYKLKCCDLQYKVNEEKGVVTAIETFHAPFIIDFNTPSRHFVTIGTARVNKEAGDVFNVEIGKKLARAKAEKAAFVKFKLLNLTYRNELLQDLQKTDNTIEKMNTNIQHQKEYIKTF